MLRVGAVALPEEPESCILVLEVGLFSRSPRDHEITVPIFGWIKLNAAHVFCWQFWREDFPIKNSASCLGLVIFHDCQMRRHRGGIFARL